MMIADEISSVKSGSGWISEWIVRFQIYDCIAIALPGRVEFSLTEIEFAE